MIAERKLMIGGDESTIYVVSSDATTDFQDEFSICFETLDLRFVLGLIVW